MPYFKPIKFTRHAKNRMRWHEIMEFIEEGVTIDLDENGHIVGIEILDATKKLSLKDIVNITIENLPFEKVETALA